MFAKLVQATWGDDTGQDAERPAADKESGGVGKPSVQEEKQGATSAPSFWGVAASLADSVKKNTAEITARLKETNWRAELEAFSKGVQEEEHLLRKETAKRVEVARERFPKDATAQLDQRKKELAAHLQNMGVGLGSFGKRVVNGTTDLFDQVKDALVEELSAHDKGKAGGRQRQATSLAKPSSKYSRLDADISTMQRDSATYCDEPADTAAYQAWRASFDLASYRPAVEALTQENAFMAELQARIVPVIVEYDAFWTRYFYQLHLLKVRHEQRMELTQRASKPQEEEVAWDDADEQNDDQPIKQSEEPAQPASMPQPAQTSPSAVAARPAAAQPAAEEHKMQNSEPGPSTVPNSIPAPTPSSSIVPQTADTNDGEGEESGPRAAADEDAPDAVTNSDSGSATEHWTVVTSPTKRADKQESSFGTGMVRASPDDTAAAGSRDAAQAKSITNPAAVDDDNDEVDDLDDVSNDDSPGSEGEEDWGTWE